MGKATSHASQEVVELASIREGKVGGVVVSSRPAWATGVLGHLGRCSETPFSHKEEK